MTDGAVQLRQRTLGGAISLSGIGLHTGKVAHLTVYPAPADSGIVVRRLSGGPVEDVPALWRNWVPQFLCSGIQGASGVPILTVEHLMASLAVFGIDNARVEIDGTEVPICDGSALAWCARLQDAGIAEQAAPRRYLKVLEPVEFVRGESAIRLEPAEHFSLHVTTSPKAFGTLVWEGVPTPEIFQAEIAPSRSHGPLAAIGAKLVYALKGEAKLQGAGLSTVAVTVGRHYLGGMRVPDEPVRHRVLDLIGDLALAGLPFLGRLTAVQPSHALNGKFLRSLMKQTQAWQAVTLN